MEWNSFRSINFCASKPRGEYLDSLLGHKTGFKPKGFLAIPHCSFDWKIWEAIGYSMCNTTITAVGEMMDGKTTIPALKRRASLLPL
jgi:hypothetical protein